MPSLWIIFVTGLLTGGLTCLAVQGGLLLSAISSRGDKNDPKLLPILMFLSGKLVSYTVLGLLLGWLGERLTPSLAFRAGLQIFVAIFMIGNALALIDLHPIFRYFIIQPPRFLTRLVRNQSKVGSMFSPAILGLMTIFIPCGTTQAMMAYAMATGNPLSGALVMFVFILATSPSFAILGFLMTKLRESVSRYFYKIAATIVILIAIWNLNGALFLLSSPFTLESLGRDIVCTISFCSDGNTQILTPATDEVTIFFERNAYRVENPNIKAGQKIRLKLVNTAGASCIQAFTLPKLGIQKIVPVGQTAELEFTAPLTPGKLPFMCSMGMYRGELNIVE